MKSVVVEASTVAKAVQAAWVKAGQPSQFFIKVLEEGSSGFLGFMAQKAKIAFYFKVNQPKEQNFPTVLAQKEYQDLFEELRHDVGVEQMNVGSKAQHKKTDQRRQPRNQQRSRNRRPKKDNGEGQKSQTVSGQKAPKPPVAVQKHQKPAAKEQKNIQQESAQGVKKEAPKKPLGMRPLKKQDNNAAVQKQSDAKKDTGSEQQGQQKKPNRRRMHHRRPRNKQESNSVKTEKKDNASS